MILDCGSNIGMAILFFKALYPDAEITAFEPAPWACAAIEETIRANDLRDVTLHNAALAEEDGTLELFHDPSHPGSAVMSVYRERMPGEPVRVPAVRLSRYVTKPVDFLKLDVEGSELPVLRDLASSGTIAQIRQMVIEFHHHMSPTVDNLSECLSILEQTRLRVSADVGDKCTRRSRADSSRTCWCMRIGSSGWVTLGAVAVRECAARQSTASGGDGSATRRAPVRRSSGRRRPWWSSSTRSATSRTRESSWVAMIDVARIARTARERAAVAAVRA